MPVYKNEKNGTWYAMIRYKDWTGTNKQKCQRGFLTRKEAVEWEAQFKLQQASDIDM
ncbi:MAG: Arm DNA-binding domain-containing protein, partial [Lachnospiraceae bacterium]|nr:Arm DNA-binding domain-containing protein [Lachnospiraceae bacterium]